VEQLEKVFFPGDLKMQDPNYPGQRGIDPIDEHRATGEMFLTNLSRSPSPIEELGHQKVHPIFTEFARASCKGFLLGLTLSCSRSTHPWLRLAIPATMAIDTYTADLAKEISYDHEYAREAWEHEYNSIGEVDEYIAYATGRGMSPEKARNIALTVTAEPSVSIPYHLAFELGMLRPSSYRRKLEHAGAVFAGYSFGMLGAEMGFWMSQWAQKGTRLPLLIPISAMILSPALIARYRYVFRMKGSRRFKAVALTAFLAALALIVGLSKS
jgi:hypothetical protein